jgi:ferrochelatase
MEVLYDLDVQARVGSEQLGLNMVRARTVGAHPRFVAMIRELIAERLRREPEPGDFCAADCCPPTAR